MSGVGFRTFKSKGPSSAARVRLTYDSKCDDVEEFYNEVTIEKSTDGSLFVVCGWSKGDVGIQQLTDNRGNIAYFKVSDAMENEDPYYHMRESEIAIEDKGPDVTVNDCYRDEVKLILPFAWSVGDTISCYVTVRQANGLIYYVGWIKNRSKGDWQKLGTIKAPRNKDDPSLSALCCFVDDLRRDYRSVNEIRRAAFTNGWVKPCDRDWEPLLSARFTVSNVEWEAKNSCDAGPCSGGFYLCTGGKTRPSRPGESYVNCNGFSPYFPSLPRSSSFTFGTVSNTALAHLATSAY